MGESPFGCKVLFCFSHVRWNYLFQRPQHLMARFAQAISIYFVEEPVFNASEDELEIFTTPESVIRVVPNLRGPEGNEASIRLQDMLEAFLKDRGIVEYTGWYYTPMALRYSASLTPSFTVYDCIAELSVSKGASPDFKEYENELLVKADLVFVSGHSLFEVKKKHHSRVFLQPGGVDVDHFGKARGSELELPDQDSIPHPRIGFFGAIDERVDLDLLQRVARLRSNWHFVMLGPIVNVKSELLPNFHNIHYLGAKAYDELPDYISGWDITMIPFVHNETTRYINPTKTLEYLAAGKPVVSTPIIDVIRPFGNKQLVRIAGTADEFVRVVDQELREPSKEEWLERVDDFITLNTWDKVYTSMFDIIVKVMVDVSPEKIEKE